MDTCKGLCRTSFEAMRLIHAKEAADKTSKEETLRQDAAKAQRRAAREEKSERQKSCVPCKGQNGLMSFVRTGEV